MVHSLEVQYTHTRDDEALIRPDPHFLTFFCSALLFQVTCVTDEGSAVTPVIKYSAGDGVGKYVKKSPPTYSLYVFVVQSRYVGHARQDGTSLQDQGIP